MVFLLRLFFALLIAGQALLRWPHWNPRYSRKFVERRQEPLPLAAKLIRGELLGGAGKATPSRRPKPRSPRRRSKPEVSRLGQHRPPSLERAIRTVNISLGI